MTLTDREQLEAWMPSDASSVALDDRPGLKGKPLTEEFTKAHGAEETHTLTVRSIGVRQPKPAGLRSNFALSRSADRKQRSLQD